MPTANFVFYFPYKGYGGVPILFLRVAEKLAQLNHNVAVIDFTDGYMASQKSAQIRLIPYQVDKPIQIPNNSTLVLQSDLPWGIPVNFSCDAKTRILFWNCYPYNFVPALPGRLSHFFLSHPVYLKLLLHTFLNSARKSCKQLVEFLQNEKAVVFMDQPNLHMTQWALNTQVLSRNYLPIPVHTQSEYNPEACGEITRLAWLGRIADFKIHSVLRIIEDLKIFAQTSDKKIHLTIIGSGEYENILNEKLAEINHFTYKLVNGIAQNELHTYLNQNVDLLFAMGTSALDGALACVPTVLMDFSYRPIAEKYRYEFLFETKEFSLGDLVTNKNISRGKNLSEILKLAQTQKSELALKCQNYVKQNHSLDKIVEKFLEYCLENQLSYNVLLSSMNLKKPWLYQLWALVKKLL